MKYSVKENNDTLILTFSGQIVLENVINIMDSILDLASKSNKDVEADLSGVDYVDSTGIGLFLKLSIIQKNKGKSFKVLNLSNRIAKIFELSSMGEY